MMTKRTLKQYSTDTVLISPSLLAADFGALRHDVWRVENEGAPLLHLDVMDGHFVPNLTFGPAVVAALRAESNMLFDVHLMIEHPLAYIKSFAQAGADHITFHVECADPIDEVIQAICAVGCTVGISVKPQTPIETILPYLKDVDMVLIMSVEPGFGGQSFMPEVLTKTERLHRLIHDNHLPIHIEMDGGIDRQTAPLAKNVGVNVLVAGTAVFRAKEGSRQAIETLQG